MEMSVSCVFFSLSFDAVISFIEPIDFVEWWILITMKNDQARKATDLFLTHAHTLRERERANEELTMFRWMWAHLTSAVVTMDDVLLIWFDCYCKTWSLIGEQMFVVYQHRINVSWKREEGKWERQRERNRDTKENRVDTRSSFSRMNSTLGDEQ